MTCPECGSDDVLGDERRATCVECEATCVQGLWASGRTLRRVRAAVQDALRRFEDES